MLSFDFSHPGTAHRFYLFSLLDLENQCRFKEHLVLVPPGESRPEFCALQHVLEHEARGEVLRQFCVVLRGPALELDSLG